MIMMSQDETRPMADTAMTETVQTSKGGNRKGASVPITRVLKLLKHMLQYQGENGLTTENILEDVYELPHEIVENLQSDALSDSQKQKLANARKQFLRDREIIDEVFSPVTEDEEGDNKDKKEKNHCFVGTQTRQKRTDKNTKGITTWKYHGKYTILELNKEDEVFLLLLGLKLAECYMYNSEDTVRDLRAKLLAAIPHEMSEQAEALCEGMDLHNKLFALSSPADNEDEAKNEKRYNENLKTILSAMHKKHALTLTYRPNKNIELKSVFSPWKVYYQDHDWYVIGAADNVPFTENLDEGKRGVFVTKDRLSRIHECLDENETAIQADDAPDYKRAMRAVEHGAHMIKIMDSQYTTHGLRFDKNKFEQEVRLHFEDRENFQFIRNLDVTKWLTEDEIIERAEPRNKELNSRGEHFEARDYTTTVGGIAYNWDLLRFILKTAANVTVDGPKELRKRIIEITEGLLERTREVDRREEEAEQRLKQYQADRKKNMNA